MVVADRHRFGAGDLPFVLAGAEQPFPGERDVIDLAVEILLTLDQAGERLLVSTATIYRWITQGSRGVRLEAAKVGGRWRTSEEAIQRFSDRLTPKHESMPSHPTPVSMSKQRQRRLERVDQRLDEMLGIRRCEACRTEIKAPNGAIPKHERVWCPRCLIKRKSASLGCRIRTFRWGALLPQHELSGRTGISIDDIRAYEHDRKEPPEAHLAKLIEALGEELVSGYERRSRGDSKLANPKA